MRQVDSNVRSRLLMARMPAMPQILLKLLEQCQAEEVGMGALAELIAKDPGITCKVLTVANSSAYHRGGARIGLEQSLTALGADMIKTLVINESVFQVFNNFTHSNSTDLRCFWKHSLSVAVLAQHVAETSGYANIEEAYLAGLLHDVGRLALLAAAKKEYAYLFFAPDDEKLCQIEQSVLNTTHADVGSWLLDHWDLDSFLADSVLYHHQPNARLEAAHPLVRIVLLAHLLDVEESDPAAVATLAQLCAVDPATLTHLRKTSQAKVVKLAEMLGIDLAGAEQLTVPTAGWEIAGLIARMEDGAEADATPEAAGAASVPAQDSAQKLLGEEVRNVVLAGEVGRSLSRQNEGEAQLLAMIVRSARVLFDFSDAAILRLNDQATAFVGVPVGAGKQRLKEFSLVLASEETIAKTALQRQVTFIAGEGGAPSIAEQQLLRLLECEALVSIPLAAGARCLGVLIGGIAQWQLPLVQGRARFLKTFGEQSASYIDAAVGRVHAASASAVQAAEAHRDASRRVIHEANNSLSIVKNYLGILDSKFEKSEVAVGELSILHEEIDRVGQIIRGFADPLPAGGESVCDVNRIVRDVVRLYREASASAAVQFVAQTREDSAGAEVACAPGALKQVLVNLIKNAVEALPRGGEVQVINNGQVNRDGVLYTEVCVRDNGPGIAPEILAALFKSGSASPRTSKGEGRGLGLSIVQGLVKEAKGLISCRSGSHGTSFEILLPIHVR